MPARVVVSRIGPDCLPAMMVNEPVGFCCAAALSVTEQASAVHSRHFV